MIYDGIVIGGGHAGIEAALAMARMNKNTLLVTGNLNKVASLPCNPSIGGPAKGIVVREIDALGGQMGIVTDMTQIQIKMLNESKGPAVRALRAQVDKIEYPKVMLDVLKKANNLELLEGLVEKIIIENGVAKGVILYDGRKLYGKTIVLTTGTYLKSNILIGHEVLEEGPIGEPTTNGISEQLKELGFDIHRLKTGTPPRIKKDSVDLSKMIVQPGDKKKHTFSHYIDYQAGDVSENCYLIHTTLFTRQLIIDNLDESSMYGGVVEGVGPRYCPSIEDKVMRFESKETHQVFLEPESLSIDEWYLQGLSTSLPRDVQEQMVKSLPGLENAVINEYAYAIEYDAINPIQLKPSLETKLVKNLFSAGQINGTSGYEEAAGQGIMAGINAALRVDEKEPFILKRNEAYIGILIDDLVTKGTKEPYRLLTSRAEFRLLLRNDNAQKRLTKHAIKYKLITQDKIDAYNKSEQMYNKLVKYCNETYLFPTKETNEFLAKFNSSAIHEKFNISHLLKRPELSLTDLMVFIEEEFSEEIVNQVEIAIKYEGYLIKEQRQAERMLRNETIVIPKDINYDDVKNISGEAREKLSAIRPQTLGQANRIIGVGPSDIAVLSVYIRSGRR